MATPPPKGPEPVAPTVRLGRPLPSPTDEPAPVPPRPGHPDDESTANLPRPTPDIRQPTIEYGAPPPVKVTVSARARPRRRFRTWPWIAAVVLALVVVGTVLVVMLLRGSTLDGDTRLIGPGVPVAPAPTVAAALG